MSMVCCNGGYHEFNLSWLIAQIRNALREWNELEPQLDYILNYFKNLNVQDEINAALEEMYENGQLEELIAKAVKYPVNALSLGCRANDETFDNGSIINEYCNNIDEKAVIYFPTGVYNVNTPIVLNNPNGVNMIGDGQQNALVYKSSVDGKMYAKNASALLFNGSGTLLSTDGDIPVYLDSMAFISNSFVWNTSRYDERPSIPYNCFSYQINNADCNGVALNSYIHSYINNCIFHGFGGTACKVYKQNYVSNSKFVSCNHALEIGNDCQLSNLHINNCVRGITVAETNIFLFETWIDNIAEYGIYSDSRINGMIDVMIDHVNYSAIYAAQAEHLQVKGRINRAGMYWAGNNNWDQLENDDNNIKFANFAQAATISIRNCQNSQFILEMTKRDIGDDNQKVAYLPNLIFNSNVWANNQVILPETDICQYQAYRINNTPFTQCYNGLDTELYSHTEHGCTLKVIRRREYIMYEVSGVLDDDNITFPYKLFDGVDIDPIKISRNIKISIGGGNTKTAHLITTNGVTFTLYNTGGTTIADGDTIYGATTIITKKQRG